MYKSASGLRISAGDLVGFLACAHLTTLSLRDLETPLPRAEADEGALLVQAKGAEHEAAYLDRLKSRHPDWVAIESGVDPEAGLRATAAAMAAGASLIYQATLLQEPFIGYADFLRRVERPSRLGDWSYEVVDTKLARSAKADFAIQLCFYSELLGALQDAMPRYAHIVLGDLSEQRLHVPDYLYYFRTARSRFLTQVETGTQTEPQPCAHCPLCPWRELCSAQWEREDHLCRVANIRREQIRKLNGAGIHTLARLARLPGDARIPRLAPGTLQVLRHQAALHLRARERGQPCYELLAPDPAGRRGFHRLPRPDPGDLFFDMEGDPLEPGGLEYLFGLYYFDPSGTAVFKAFWAHERRAERQAFEAFMDFVGEHLRRYPDAHIYHYAHYEQTALKRLMSVHGSREVQVDDLLRREKLVDLYKVVREGLRISEPSYSIKNLEAFYMGKRGGEVVNAAASIVAYEKWRATGDARLLQQIQDYNEDDCRSTYELRQWLLQLRPPDLPWFHGTPGQAAPEKSERIVRHEARLQHYAAALLCGDEGPEREFHELVYQLLDFYRREAKPQWWALFARQDMSVEELREDAECLAGLERIAQPEPAGGRARSLLYRFRFSEQEHKLHSGQSLRRTDTLEPVGSIQALDEEDRVLVLKSTRELPDRLSVTGGEVFNTDPLQEAVFRFADSVLAGEGRFAAVEALLRRRSPRLENHAPGTRILAEEARLPDAVADAVAALVESCLFIQGPPGAGKTYTGSYVIAELIRRGHRVGISSNSHKAINHLLGGVERWARKRGIAFRGVKKASGEDSSFDGEYIRSCHGNAEAVAALDDGARLIAGTAWLFAGEALDGALDYLFVDEAGQLSLAHLVAMGTSARNIVLLGDPMQLGQPLQGSHPGRSGESALEYLLAGRATVEPECGIFLPTTYRMHPDVCGLISAAIYDGRLQSDPATRRQRLQLGERTDPRLKASGVQVLEVAHEDCSQRSEEEAAVIAELYTRLIGTGFIDRNGNEDRLGSENILVVAPYNMQVNLLRQCLPAEARVGTVDRFQGQEAEVVLVSMTTSSGEQLPRNIEFLFSRNRLNVALSRARILVVVVMNPALAAVHCNTLEQMALVNTLCWVREYAAGPGSAFMD